MNINNRKYSFMKVAASLLFFFSCILHFRGESQTAATITQSGWYRIAQNGTIGGSNGSRAAAHFIVMDRTSGLHQTVEFLAYINFQQMPSIVVLNNSYYSASHIPIPKVRILAPSSTYAGSAVEVYIDATGNNAESFLIEDNTQSNGWTTIDWQQVGTGTGDQDGVPAGFTACVLGLKDLVTGYVTKSGTQTSYVNGNFYTSGNLLLGKTTQTNSAYKLDINGNARANEIVVNTTGADFVFDSTYNLLSLDSIQKFIARSHHLPELPSALEMQKEGLKLGQNQTKLLQKIEELTLYLLEQRKTIKEQNLKQESYENRLKQQSKLIETQSSQLKLLEQRLQKLETNQQQSQPSPVKATIL